TRSEVLRIGQNEKRVPDRPPRPFAQADRWLIKFERWDKTALRGSVVDVRHAEGPFRQRAAERIVSLNHPARGSCVHSDDAVAAGHSRGRSRRLGKSRSRKAN